MSTLWGDWVFTWLGWGLAGVGGALLAWSLFWDRSRGRKRCPKCWYSMEGAPGLTCPECGKVVKSERKLRKTRRRWRGAVVAVVVFALAYGAWVTPRVQKRGWPAAVPTVGLIVVCRWMGQSEFSGLQRRQPSAAEHAWSELVTQRPQRMWRWERWLAVESCIRGDAARPPESDEWVDTYGQLYVALQRRGAVSNSDQRRLWERALPQIVETRDRWPVGSRIYARMKLPISMSGKQVRHLEATLEPGGYVTISQSLVPLEHGGPVYRSPWSESTISIGTATGGHMPVKLIVRLLEVSVTEWNRDTGWKWNAVGEWTIERTLEVVPTIDDVLLPIRAVDLEAEIARSLRLTYMAPNLQVDLPPIAMSRFHKVAVAMRIEFVCDGEVRAHGSAECFPRASRLSAQPRSTWTNVAFAEVSGDVAALERAITNGDPWTVRITGVPRPMLDEFDCDSYWAGQIKLPLSAVSHGPGLGPTPVPSVIRGQ